MNTLQHTASAVSFLCLLFSCASFGQPQANKPPTFAGNPMRVEVKDYLKQIRLPRGFKIDLFAENVEGARSLALGPKGTVFAGTFQIRKDGKNHVPGKVYALLDQNNDHQADQIFVIADSLNKPNGVAFRNGDLYVAEINRILRFDKIEENLSHPPQPVIINDGYPTNAWHGWKFIRFGPDDKLYVPVGAPCNTCERSEEIFASMTRLDHDGTNLEIFAKGIRNTVGFDWHPETKELWFTDNGRDEWGDDIPPEELNHAPRPDLHFGFPYHYGKALIDTTYKIMPAGTFQPAAIEMPAHVAPLGMRFYTGNSFPKEYHHQIFLAEHGSWNRSMPDGYRVSLVRLKENHAVKYEPFATGWLMDNKYWGRPVDVLVMPDGALLVSDDFANCIYRISHEK